MTFPDQWRVHLDQSRFSDLSRLYVFRDVWTDGKPKAVEIQQFGPPVVVEEGSSLIDTPCTLAIPSGLMTTFLQRLVDEAYRVGIKPTALTATSIEYAAQEKHLSDMRKIVGKFVKVEL